MDASSGLDVPSSPGGRLINPAGGEEVVPSSGEDSGLGSTDGALGSGSTDGALGPTSCGLTFGFGSGSALLYVRGWSVSLANAWDASRAQRSANGIENARIFIIPSLNLEGAFLGFPEKCRAQLFDV